MMQDDVTTSRGATYLGFFVGLWAGHLLLRDSSWQGSAELHALMEAIATFLALFVGIMALVRFYSKKTTLYLFIGTGFLGTGLLDAYHAIATSPWSKDLFPAILPPLIPWSGIASSVFLSVCLWLSLQTWKKEPKVGEAGKTSERIMYLTAGLLTLAGFLFFAFFSLPRAYYPEIVFSRPEELIAAWFFLLALVGYLHKGHWKQDDFEHWLVLALIVGFSGQAMFMSFSARLFDGMFDSAHLLKNASYFFVLIALVISMYDLFRRAEGSTQELAQANEILQREIAERKRAEEGLGAAHEKLEMRVEERTAQLAYANEILQREIAERKRAKEALEKAHEEVETWVQERTAQLAYANKILQREIAERKRAESELEVLHEVSRQLDSTLELEDVLELALVKVKDLLGVDLAVISIVDEGSGGLVLRAHPQVPHEQIESMLRSEVGEWISGKAPEGWDPVLVDHLSERHRLSSLATTLGGIESLICVPLKAKGTVIGHMTLATAKAGLLTEKGIPFLSSAASVVATAIDNARLYAQTKKDGEAKARLLRELNHRVRNNLATIVGLLSMELGRKRRWTAEEALKASIDRVQSLAAVHDLLAQDEFRELDLKKLVEDVAKATVRGLSWEENVKITVDAPPLRLPPNSLSSLALAANELITNALMHAFRSHDAGLIQVRVTQEGGEIQLEVRDNGSGIPTTKDGNWRKGVGLDIVTSLVETDLRGQFQLRKDKGTVATIRFPRPKRAES
ncbi:MAG: histidine kinase dimerization/phosphoacceptor domain -containing protein [candidate division NC10 bacterium]|jgi:two-component sensor histidine kinase|nr:histidine kinase dimerization/phosphoacceptor domain -containing protein [Nitrospirota bacterium]